MTGDRLAEAGIFLRRPDRPGEHRTSCSHCDRGPRDDALAVRIDLDGSATWCCHRCGWQGGFKPERPERSARPAPRRQQPQRDLERHETLALCGRAVWASCRPIAAGSVAATYLERRACAVPHPDGHLRWHPAIRHRSGHIGPALVALVTDVETCELINLHRTWLRPDGSGKADLEQPRLLLAKHRKAGGCVRLWPDEEVTLGLAIAEGLESALAAARVFPPIWSTLDAANMAAFPMLAGVEALTIFADHDAPDRLGRRRGIEAAQACAERWAAAGRQAWLDSPSTPGADFNDVAAGAVA